MANYCTTAEALSLIPWVGTLSASTEPTSTQADTITTAITSEIDMRIRARGLTLPVTDTSALASLKTTALYGAAAAIAKAMKPASDGMGGDEGAAGFWEAKYQAALTRIDEGALDPEIVASTSGRIMEGFTEDDEGEDTEPYVYRTTEW